MLLFDNMPTPELSEKFCHEISQWLFEQFEDALLATVHGSYLYGLAHKDSDIDVFVVTLNGKNTQKEYVTESGYTLDIRQHSLDRYVSLLQRGSCLSVEAFFSPYAVFNKDSYWYPYLRSQRVSFAKFAKNSLSVSENFIEFAEKKPKKSEKFLRHSQRLQNKVLYAFDNDGSYNPAFSTFKNS